MARPSKLGSRLAGKRESNASLVAQLTLLKIRLESLETCLASLELGPVRAVRYSGIVEDRVNEPTY